MAKEELGIRQSIFRLEEIGKAIEAKQAELEELRAEARKLAKGATAYIATVTGETPHGRPQRTQAAFDRNDPAFQAFARTHDYKIPARGRIKISIMDEFRKSS